MQPTYLKMNQVLGIIPVSRVTIYRWIKAKAFPEAVKIAGTHLWDQDAVYRAIGRLPETAVTKATRSNDDLI